MDSVYWKEILIHSLRTNVNATFHLQFFFYIYIIKFCFFFNIVAIKRNYNDSVDVLSTSSIVHCLKISRFDELCILKQKVSSTSYGPLVRDSINLSRLSNTKD